MTNNGTEKTSYDVIIVGGGPAGLCAAMYSGRGMIDALLIERGLPGGELLNTELIEDYPGFESILGTELAKKMTSHAEKFGASIVTDTVDSIEKMEDGDFEVLTQLGKTYRGAAVILTAGGTPNKLGIPGELEWAGRGVSYCAVCDGAFFKGETIAVIGGGDAAVEEATYLTRYGEKVYLIHRREEFRASALLQARAFGNPKIEAIRNKVVEEIEGGATGATGLILRDTKTGERSNLAATGVFIFIGFSPNSGLIKGHSLAASMNMVSGSQIRRYNFESLLLLKSSLEGFQADFRAAGHPVEAYMVEVSFDLLEDPEEREYFRRTATSFFLTDDRVDRLRAVGRRLLAESPELQELLEKLRASE